MDIETRPRSHQKLLLRLIFGGVVVLAALAGWLWWLGQEAQTPRSIMAAAQRRVNFGLFYPAEMPAGFAFGSNSISVTDQVVTYLVSYDKTKSFVVSIQPNGNGSPEDTFNPTSDFTTTIGHAYIADVPDRTTAAVVGDKSWVLINAPKKIAIDKLTQFINSLRPL